MTVRRLGKPFVRWQTLFVKVTVWLSAEILLGMMGLDNLADYSEFVFQRQVLVQMTETLAYSPLSRSLGLGIGG